METNISTLNGSLSQQHLLRSNSHGDVMESSEWDSFNPLLIKPTRINANINNAPQDFVIVNKTQVRMAGKSNAFPPQSPRPLMQSQTLLQSRTEKDIIVRRAELERYQKSQLIDIILELEEQQIRQGDINKNPFL